MKYPPPELERTVEHAGSKKLTEAYLIGLRKKFRTRDETNADQWNTHRGLPLKLYKEGSVAT